MPHYKLTYFNFRAKGEVARLLFAAAGEEFEDVRVEFERWPEVKSTTPFGQLPMLEVDGQKLCQSNTICRYLADKFGLAGKTEWDKARADMIVNCIEDVVINIGYIIHEPDEVTKERRGLQLQEQIPVFFGKFENILNENEGGNGYFVGDSMTWADLAFLNLFSWLPLVSLKVLLEDFPKLKALKQRVESEAKIAEWLAKRPESK